MGKKLLVSGVTTANSLKASIVGNFKDNNTIYLDSIGVAANYVATKAIILTRAELFKTGEKLDITPIYKDFEIKDPQNAKVKTGIRWVLSKQ